MNAGLSSLPLGATSDLANAGLSVQRTDILFHDVAPGRVAIEVTVTNQGYEPTSPTFAAIQAAPLGAFVAWQPLTVLPVPVLGPGESFVLRAEARRPQPAPVGPPQDVTPDQLLTAVGTPDPAPDAAGLPLKVRQRLRAVPVLPADLNDLLGRGNFYWAGNLNVFVGGKAVERHLARALRVHPGRLNMALFVVGDHRPDAYRFRLDATGEDWKASLFDCTNGWPVFRRPSGQAPVAEGRWVETTGVRLMTLALRPPADCGTGSVEVRVTQRSTGKVAVVEFSLSPDAAGAGCYAV
jgi:hypothetical protein